jgi:predicted NUDIX family NTP pyrophosphohydrolase
MSKPVSAGCVVTRSGEGGVEVLLVHARGASFRRPLFGIPKGLVEEGEDHETTARRETEEETGLEVHIRASLGSIQQKSGKIVHAFWATIDPASEGDIDDKGRCLRPDAENDVCRFYPIDKCAEMMIPAQRELLERVAKVIGNQ